MRPLLLWKRLLVAAILPLLRRAFVVVPFHCLFTSVASTMGSSSWYRKTTWCRFQCPYKSPARMWALANVSMSKKKWGINIFDDVFIYHQFWLFTHTQPTWWTDAWRLTANAGEMWEWIVAFDTSAFPNMATVDDEDDGALFVLPSVWIALRHRPKKRKKRADTSS